MKKVNKMMAMLNFIVVMAFCAVLAFGCGGGGTGGGSSLGSGAGGSSGGGESSNWIVQEKDGILEIYYGLSATNYPEFAALHLGSSYFRMVYGPESGWGSSAIILPCVWVSGKYYQGAEISVISSNVDGNDLVITFSGTISSLKVEGNIRIKPPGDNSIQAIVSITSVSGDIVLDNRPGEAFKPAGFSSMNINSSQWDASEAYVGAQNYSLPLSGWIISPPANGTIYGLKGGTSDWKHNAPSLEINFDRALSITGRVTQSTDPTGDNIGYWCASDTVLRSWQYTITASKPN